MQLKYVDLFSGIGGFRSAAAGATIGGVELSPVASADTDPTCRAFYAAANNTDGEFSLDDVRDIEVLGGGSIRLPDFDVLFGGFPCQPFANIGLRGGLIDPRGDLFFNVVRILKTYRPRFFVLENVQKMRNHERGATLNRIKDELTLAGYHVTVWDLCASDYGLPQQRRRLFFCGACSETFDPMQNLNPPQRQKLEHAEYPSTWHLLERSFPSMHMVPPLTRKTVLRKNDKWQGDLEIDRRIARPLTASMSKWHRANQDNYFSEAYVFGNHADGSKPSIDLDSEPIRRITPLEGFRLQGFPDWYEEIRRELKISNSAAYRLIGNAVPVKMAGAVITQFLSSYLNRNVMPQSAECLPAA
jgi:DNA (cytosine-5)-methyltransferase 1